MSVQTKSTGRATSMPVGLAWGGVTSLLMTLAASGLLAWLVSKETMKQNQIGYGVMVLLVVSSLCGAKVAYGKIKRQRLAVCMIAGAVYFGILMAMTALFFGGQYSGVGETALMVFCGSLLAVLLKTSGGRIGKTRKKRKDYR